MIEGLKFENIEEIKFTRVGENTYAISIKSDIRKDEDVLRNGIFESDLCVIDSPVELSCEKQFAFYDVGFNKGISEIYSIPMVIKLLAGKDLKRFTIKENNN